MVSQISSWFRKRLMISPLDSDSYENVMPRAMARDEKRDEYERDTCLLHRISLRVGGIESIATVTKRPILVQKRGFDR